MSRFYRWLYLRRVRAAYAARGIHARHSDALAVARCASDPGTVALLAYSRGNLIITEFTPTMARALAQELCTAARAAQELEPFDDDATTGDEWKDGER